MRKFIFISITWFAFLSTNAQMPGGFGRPGAGATRSNMNVGHFYGKVVDSKTGKGIAGATVILSGNKFDTVTKQMKQGTIKTLIAENNGDFSLENLPVFGNFKLKISALGFKTIEKQVSFNIKMPTTSGGGFDANALTQAMAAADKDLGNIKLETDATDLGNVTVTSTAKQQLELGIDRKVFNVDKNLNSTGQTATEIMKSIPSVSVDIDGNVTLRNAAPTIFVDGRPTTMTLDQIPADIIDKIEIITNPSAKYDASGGNAGILNIVLKKNKKTGYNGGLRAGIDSRGKTNLGGDINLRQNKINLFASGNFNERKSISTNYTSRINYLTPPSNVISNTDAENNGYFGFFRGGLDYFVDNRNTISFTGNYVKGSFNNDQTQIIDSSINKVYTSNSQVSNTSNSTFQNWGSQLSYKHNFEKSGHNLTGDFNYNSSTNNNTSYINSYTYFPYTSNPKQKPLLQQTLGNGYNHSLTIQADYENPLTETTKLEAGVRAAIRDNKNENNQYILNTASGLYELSPIASSNYKFNDQVYAAYTTYTFKYKKWNFQAGLRAESSNYTGTKLSTTGKDSSFKVDYPLSLFPSIFSTLKIDATQDFQVNFSRRINRPNFFQLIPFPDYSDPQNISIGNAGLKPEFTYSFEMSYNNAYKKNANFLVSVYYKYNTDLITRYTYRDVNQITKDSAYFFSYINANSASTYGIELTDKHPITKWWDLTANINIFNSNINATIPGQTVDNSLVSWFGKLNNNFKLPKGWSIQLSGDYYAKSILPQSSSGGNTGGRGGGGGGMMWGGGQQGSAQGYILPRYSVDAAIRKDWTWKNGQSGSLTLGMNDVFRTQLYKTYSESTYFSQNTERRRDPQVLRLNFSYRFGKFDLTLFKRKNTKADQTGGLDMINQ
jgi:outer membrane receptor protein involved in Fe transport